MTRPQHTIALIVHVLIVYIQYSRSSYLQLIHASQIKMAQSLLAMSMRRLIAQNPAAVRCMSTKLGNREVVGYGVNGMPVYVDRVDYPMPAIRFKENTKEILALREKEKGDWNKLSLHEKKALYRASFCQTFAEIKAPTGEWKPCVSGVLVASSLALLICIFMNVVGKCR